MGSSQNFGDTVSPPLKMDGVANPRETRGSPRVITGAQGHGQGGTCPPVEKLKSVIARKKNSHLLSQVERPRRFVKKDWTIAQHRLFHFCRPVYYTMNELCVVVFVFSRRTTWRRTRSPIFGIGKPMLLSPDFTTYTGDQGQNRSRHWSSRGQKLHTQKIYLRSTDPLVVLSPNLRAWAHHLPSAGKKSRGRPCALFQIS